jgi:hypothetical protein
MALRLKRRALAIYSLAQLVVWMIIVCHVFACFFYGIATYAISINEPSSWLIESSLQNNINQESIET